MLKQVAEGVLVHQSALLQNNTVVVEGSAGVLVIDPGITDEEMTCLADDVRRLGPVVAAFATHPHWDHVLWHAELGDAPRYGTADCADALRGLRSTTDWATRVAGALPPEIAGQVPLDGFGLITGVPGGSAHVPWDGPSVRIVEHPAHEMGHAALLIEEAGVLVAGDMLSDLFVPMLGDPGSTGDPVEDYLTGLRSLAGVVGDIGVLVPGHGSVCDADQARARVELDRAYVDALRDGSAPDDPRIRPSADPGSERVRGVHAAQVRRFGSRDGLRPEA